MTFEIVEVRDGAVTLRITGATRAEDRGKGFEPTLLGRAVWRKDRFTTFDLVAVGRQWGNPKRDSDGSVHPAGTMGVAFRLADPNDPTDRVAPAFFGLYGWRR